MHPTATMKNPPNVHMLSFFAEQRYLCQGSSNSRGSLVDYETHKITATTMSTTVAELHGLTRCYGSALFLRGLWSDIQAKSRMLISAPMLTTLLQQHPQLINQAERNNALNPNVAKGEQ